MSKQILPDIDLLNSREFYGAYNSKDLYKGKSFNMAGEWSPEVHYFNDDFVVDFVSYQGALLSCKRSHQSSSQNAPELQYNIVNGFRVPCGVAQNSYWTFVLGAIPGEKGDTGSIYTPIYNERTGELEWQLEESTTPIAPMRIKGAGIDDIYTRTDGTKQLVHIVYDGGKETEIVEIPHGKDGKDGRDGSELIDVDRVEGENGDTYIFKFKEHNGVIRNYSVFVKRGPKGDTGKNATIEVVEVKNLPHGSKPTVKNVGSDTNAKLSFGLPEAPATPAFKLEYGKDGYDQLSVNLL